MKIWKDEGIKISFPTALSELATGASRHAYRDPTSNNHKVAEAQEIQII